MFSGRARVYFNTPRQAFFDLISAWCFFFVSLISFYQQIYLATFHLILLQRCIFIISSHYPISILASACCIDEGLDKVCDDQTWNSFLMIRLLELSLKIPLIKGVIKTFRLHCHMISLQWNESVVIVFFEF